MALTITDVTSFTKTFIIPRAVQNFFRSNALAWRLKRKGMRYDGGLQIEAPIFHTGVTAGGAYQDRDALVITNNNQNTNAVYQLREYYTHISVSGRDMARNSGVNAVKSFLKMKINHAKDNIADLLGTALQGSNTSGKDIDGLGLTLSTSSTYGGVAVADAPVWVAQVQAAGANTMTLIRLQKVLGACTFGASRPTLIISNQAVYDKFSTFGDTVQRIIDTDMASIGIAQLNFRGVPWVVDSHAPSTGDGAITNVAEFLNEDYLELWTHRDWDFKMVDIAQQPDEDVKRVNLFWKGNLVCHSRRHQGELSAIDPAL